MRDRDRQIECEKEVVVEGARKTELHRGRKR